MARKKLTLKKEKLGLIELNPNLNVKVDFLEMDYIKPLTFIEHNAIETLVEKLISSPELATNQNIEYIDKIITTNFAVFINEEEFNKINEARKQAGLNDVEFNVGLNEKLLLLLTFLNKEREVLAENKKK